MKNWIELGLEAVGMKNIIRLVKGKDLIEGSFDGVEEGKALRFAQLFAEDSKIEERSVR